MKFFEELLKLKSAAAVEYSLVHIPFEQESRHLKTDAEYVRVWLRSARITDVRRWATKFYAGAHARFEFTDWKAGKREVLSVIAPDKTFEELDPARLDRLITVNQPLLGPVPFRGELTMDVGLFSVPSEDLAKPYLNLLTDITKTAGVSFLSQASVFLEPLRRGAELIFSKNRSELEIGISRTDTNVAVGHWVVARKPKNSLPEGLRLDPADFGLLDSNGNPLTGFPYMVIGVEGVSARDDYHSIPEVRTSWDAVRAAAADNQSVDEVLNRFGQLRRAVGLSSELVSSDKRRITATFARELADAGYETGLPLLALESMGGARNRPLRTASDVLALLPNAATMTARSASALESAARPEAAANKLSMRQLQELMGDPNVPDKLLRHYFTVVPGLSQPFAPAVVIDPSRVEVAPATIGLEGALGMGFANQMARWRRQERFNARLARGDTRPVLVSEGDSWFQFPIFLEDVIDHLEENFNVWSVDSAGDTLDNMVLGKPEFMKALHRHKDRIKAFLFSGGGNDILGTNIDGVPYVSLILKEFEAGQPAQWYLENQRFSERLRFIEDCYRRMLGEVAAQHPFLPVVCHGYDRAIPGGFPGDSRNPLWASQDQWIGKPLRSLGIEDPGLQREIVGLIVDRFNQRLRSLCGGNHPGGTFQNAFLVDVRGVVGERWADELHPLDDGYKDVAQRFATQLSQILHHTMSSPGASSGALESMADCDDSLIDGADRAGAMRINALEAVRPWRVAGSLLKLRREVDAHAPNRSTASDGTIGNAAHQRRDSDHNPWVEDGAYGVVTAMDITHDPDGGCDAGKLAQALLASRDDRLKYVIWNRQIFSASVQPWQWRPYGGSNPHTKHVHISVNEDQSRYDNEGEWRVA